MKCEYWQSIFDIFQGNAIIHNNYPHPLHAELNSYPYYRSI